MRPALLPLVKAFSLVVALGFLVAPVPGGSGVAAAAPPAKAGSASTPIDAWVMVRAGSREVRMSGSTRDIKRARALQQSGESLLYLRRGGKAYVVRDVASLDRVDALWAPMEAQGKKMDALGKQMDPLGKKMDALGKRMERTHDTDEQDALSRQMDELGRQMDELGRQMDALGKEMDRLGKKAEDELAVLVDELVKSGKATEVKAPL
jgi:hypothetical protein